MRSHVHPSTFRTPLAFAAGVLALASLASASFTTTFDASFHGQPWTRYAQWESFTQPNLLPNSPDVPGGTSPNAAVYQLASGGVITSAGNLDDLTVPPVYAITETVPGDAREVVLQVCILLNPINWNSFTLTYTDGLGTTHVLLPTTSTYLVHLMGRDERVITWDLTGVADVVGSYRIDFAATNSFTTLDAVKLDTRFDGPSGLGFCAGDGLDPLVTVACPCGNFGAAGNGCANSVNAVGAHLDTFGTVANDDLSLAGTLMPATVSCIYLQGDANGKSVFGDGVRCAGGTLLRLRTRSNVGGASFFPDSTDTITLSQRGGVTIGSGATRYYQTYYRNSAPLFCPPETFNVTNGVIVTW